VGEEHGHLFTLAFESALGGEDPLGEVLGRVQVGRLELNLRSHTRSGNWRTAAATELLAAFILEAAGRTRQGQRLATVAAEAATRAILSVTVRTLHSVSSRASESGDGRTALRMVVGEGGESQGHLHGCRRGATKSSSNALPPRAAVRGDHLSITR